MNRNLLTQIYSALLRLYPAEYRKAWSHGMEATFERRAREAGGADRIGFVVKEFASVVRTALGEWRARSQRSGPPRMPGPAMRRAAPGPSPRSPRRQIVSHSFLDVRVALRGWRREPATTAVIILTLTLGIGATTAIFSVVDGTLLRPLPFPAADRLFDLEELLPSGAPFTLSMPDFVDYRAQATSLDGVAVYDATSIALTGEGEAERINGMEVSPGFFEMLGLDMSLGRSLNLDDEAEDAPLAVILGHSFWRDRFAANPGVLGSTLRIEGRERTVVGVAPADVALGGDEPKVWLPFSITRDGMRNRGGHMYPVMARLADGVTIETAREEVGLIARNIIEATSEYHDDGGSATLVPLKDAILGDVDRPLLTLLGAVGMLLLIACANVASIMLVRADAREGEVAVRAALGASSGRLVRQLLTDAVMLAAAGGLIGVVLAHFGVRAIVDNLAANLPRAREIGADPRVLGFALVVTLGTGILVGLFPALRVSRNDLYSTMRAGSPTQTAGRRSSASHRVLVVAEIALAVVLVLGASLLMQSLARLQGVESGFVAEGALTFRVGMPDSRYDTMEAAGTFIHDLEAELGRLPGVRAVGAVGLLPFFASQTTGIAIAGEDPELGVGGAQFRYATPGYFDAIGTPLLRGRVFSDRDTVDAPAVIVISQTLARELFGDADPVGRQVYIPGWDGPEAIEVIGVVEDVRLTGLAQQAPPAMYWPYGQWNWRSTMSFVVRAGGDPMSLIPPIRQIMGRLDPDLPVYSVELLADRTRRTVAEQRLTTWLLSGAAGLALLFGAVGIFGVMAYSVVKRTHEIGVRVALGASPAKVTRTVLLEGAALAALGVVLGTGGALGLGRTFAYLLYETSPTDPLTFLGVGTLLVGVALLACFLPARRAARVDPMVTLRDQ